MQCLTPSLHQQQLQPDQDFDQCINLPSQEELSTYVAGCTGGQQEPVTSSVNHQGRLSKNGVSGTAVELSASNSPWLGAVACGMGSSPSRAGTAAGSLHDARLFQPGMQAVAGSCTSHGSDYSLCHQAAAANQGICTTGTGGSLVPSQPVGSCSYSMPMGAESIVLEVSDLDVSHGAQSCPWVLNSNTVNCRQQAHSVGQVTQPRHGQMWNTCSASAICQPVQTQASMGPSSSNSSSSNYKSSNSNTSFCSQNLFIASKSLLVMWG